MPSNECIPYYEPASRFTGRATGDITGKRFVSVSAAITGGIAGSGNINVAMSAAGDRAIAVAAYDVAQDDVVPLLAGPGMIVPVTAGEAIEAGDLISAGTDGVAMIVTGFDAGTPAPESRVLGVAVDDASNGADCPVRLFI